MERLHHTQVGIVLGYLLGLGCRRLQGLDTGTCQCGMNQAQPGALGARPSAWLAVFVCPGYTVAQKGPEGLE